MREELFDLSTTERQLLYDIRSEIRITNDLMAKQLEVLHAIAKHTEPKDSKVKELKAKKPVKPKQVKEEKPKRRITNGNNK